MQVKLFLASQVRYRRNDLDFKIARLRWFGHLSDVFVYSLTCSAPVDRLKHRCYQNDHVNVQSKSIYYFGDSAPIRK